MLEHRASEVRDRELARGPQQESFAELRFEGGNPSRDRRFGQADALRSARKAALLHDACEDQEVVGLEIHGAAYCCCSGTMISILTASGTFQQQIYWQRGPSNSTERSNEHTADQLQRPSRRVPLDPPREPHRGTPARERARLESHGARSQRRAASD